MAFNSKKLGSEFARSMVLEGHSFWNQTLVEAEINALQTLTDLSQAPLKEKKEFEEGACQELNDSNWKRKLGFTEARHQLSFFEEYGRPNCQDPKQKKQMVLDMLDYRFGKSILIKTFRGPELERMRSLYLTGQDQEPSSRTYAWDGRILDFRSGEARATLLIFSPLMIAYPVLNFFFSSFGISSGRKIVERAQQKFKTAQTERERNEAIREEQQGRLIIGLGGAGLVSGYLRVLQPVPTIPPDAPSAKIFPFDQAARTTPLPPPPTNPGEEIINFLTSARRAVKALPINPANVSDGSPTGSSQNPKGFSNSASSSQSTTPSSIRTASTAAERNPSALAMTIDPPPIIGGGEVTPYSFEGTVALASQPVEVVPIRPLTSPASLQDGPFQSFLKFLVLIDREGKHIPHASILYNLSRIIAPTPFEPSPASKTVMQNKSGEAGAAEGIDPVRKENENRKDRKKLTRFQDITHIEMSDHFDDQAKEELTRIAQQMFELIDGVHPIEPFRTQARKASRKPLRLFFGSDFSPNADGLSSSEGVSNIGRFITSKRLMLIDGSLEDQIVKASLIHEFGHVLDHLIATLLKAKSSHSAFVEQDHPEDHYHFFGRSYPVDHEDPPLISSFYYWRESSSHPHPLLRDLKKVLLPTERVQYSLSLLRMLHDESQKRKLSENEITLLKALLYALQPQEVFADAYLQYIAHKTQEPDLNLELSSVPNYQVGAESWRQFYNDAEFEPICKAMDDLWMNLGWKR